MKNLLHFEYRRWNDLFLGLLELFFNYKFKHNTIKFFYENACQIDESFMIHLMKLQSFVLIMIHNC